MTDAAGPGAAVQLHGVGVTIDGTAILDGIDWTVADGERWVLLGRNGSGKTTLLRVVGLTLHPSTGEVTVLGGRLGRIDVRTHRRRIGATSAAVERSLRPDLTATEVVVTALYGALEPWWHTYTEADHARARSLLRRFGVEALADHPLGTLSSGERQRTLLARALMSEPDLLILDEPTAGLDLGGREELVRDLAVLAADRSTPPLILVTHHLEEIPVGFTHALLLRDGRTSAAGPISEVLRDDLVSACYGLDVEVREESGRWSARAR